MTDSNLIRQRNPLIGGGRVQREVRDLLTSSDGLTVKQLADSLSIPSKSLSRVSQVEFVLHSLPDAYIDHWTKREESPKWDAVWMIAPPPPDTPKPDD